MKKVRLLLITAALAAALVAVMAFAACGGEGKTTATLTATYVNGSTASNSYGGFDADTYQFNVYDDGSYVMVHTTVNYGYSMCLGTTVVTTYGTYKAGASVDGYTPYELSEATRVVLNSYSRAGGYDIYVDTDTSTYPVELPAENEGEKNMAQSKEDVINAYGQAMTVYVGANAHTFELTDPTA